MAEYLNRLDNKYFTKKNKSISIIDNKDLFNELEIIANNINTDLTVTIDNAIKQIVQGNSKVNTFFGINENLELDFITIDKCINDTSILSTTFEDRRYTNSLLLTSIEIQNRITPIQQIKFPNNNNTILINNKGNLLFSKIDGTFIDINQIIPNDLIAFDTLDSTILADDVIDKNIRSNSIIGDYIQNYSINYDEKIYDDKHTFAFHQLIDRYFNDKFDIADEQLPKLDGNKYPQDSRRKAYITNDIIADNTITPEKFADNIISWHAFAPYNAVNSAFDNTYQFIHGDSINFATIDNMLYDMNNRTEENYNKVLDLLDEDFLIEHDDLPKIYDANTTYNDPQIRNYKGLQQQFFSRSLANAIQLWLNDNN